MNRNILKIFTDTLFRLLEPKHQDMLNESLYLAMEFGEDWLQPIQQRLLNRHKDLSVADADEFNNKTKEIMNYSFTLIEKELDNKFKENAVTKSIKEKYPELSKRSIKALFNQGTYYANK